MSQVIRKYKEGKPIKLEDSQLFHRDGYGAYKREDIANALANEEDLKKFIQDEQMNEEDAQYFRELVGQAKLGIRDGSFVKMDEQGIYNTAGFDNDGTTEHKRFLGIKMPGKRGFEKSAETDDNKNNALLALNRYFANRIGTLSTYDYDKELKAYNEKHPAKKLSMQEKLANAVLGGVWSEEAWNGLDYDPTTKTYGTKNRLAAYSKVLENDLKNEEFDTDVYTDINDYKNSIQAAIDALKDGDISLVDRQVLAKVGLGNIYSSLGVPQLETSPEKSETEKLKEEAVKAGASTEEAIDLYIKNKEAEQERASDRFTDALRRQDFMNQYLKLKPFSPTIQPGVINDVPKYDRNNIDKSITDWYGEGHVDDYLNEMLSRKYFEAGSSQHLANMLDYIDMSLLPDIGDGWKAIPSTFDWNNYSTIIYNPQTRQYKEVSMLVNQALRNITDNYLKEHAISVKKNGGTIEKFQFGGTYSQRQAYEQQEPQQEKEVKKSETELPKVSSRKLKDGWTWEDYTHAGAIGADIASLIAAYAPGYGTIASAGLGYGSTIADYVANASENGFNLGDLGTAGINLGLDTIGLIPGLGTSAKTGKIVKNALKIAPKLLTAFAAINYTGPALESTYKLIKGEDISVDDLRNIGEGIKLITQGGAGYHAHRTVKKLNKDLATGNKIITTADGKQVKVTDKDFAEIKSKKTKQELDAALQVLSGDDNAKLITDLNKRWFNPARYFQNNGVTNELDFNKTKTVSTSRGNKEVPIVYTGNEKYHAARMQNGMHNPFSKFHPFKTIGNKYNDFKYRKYFKEQNAKTANDAFNSIGKAAYAVKVAKSLDPSQLLLPAKSVVPRATINRSISSEMPTGLTSVILRAPGAIITPVNPSRRISDVSKTNFVKPDRGFNHGTILTDLNVKDINTLFEDVSQVAAGYKKGILAKESTRESLHPKESERRKTRERINREAALALRDIQQSDPNSLKHQNKERMYKKIFGPLIKAHEKELKAEALDMVYSNLEKTERELAKLTALVTANLKRTSKMSKNSRRKKLDALEQVFPRTDAARVNALSRKKAELTARNVDAILNKFLVTSIPLYKSSLSGAARTNKQKMYEQLFSKPKKASRKKSSKKDDGFVGSLFKQGGVFKYLNSGVMKRNNQWLSQDNTFANARDTNKWASYYDMNSMIKDFASNFKESNAQGFIDSANKLNSMNLSWKPELNARGYSAWNTEYDKTGLNTYFGSDSSRFDYMGPSTYNRLLLLNELLKKYTINNPLQSGDTSIYYSDKDKKWRLYNDKPVPERESPFKVTVPKIDKLTPVNTQNTKTRNPQGVIKGGETSNKEKWHYGMKLPDALDLGKVLTGFVVNGLVAKKTKEGLRPTTVETWENLVPQVGNFAAKSAANQLATNTEYLAGMPRTSDSRLQLAGELEGNRLGNESRFKGVLADIDTWYKTGMLSQQESDAAKARRVQASNQNRAAVNAIDAAKSNIDAGLLAANYQQLFAPYMTNVVNQMNQNEAIGKQLTLESYLNNGDLTYKAELERLQKQYENDNEGFIKAVRDLKTRTQE